MSQKNDQVGAFLSRITPSGHKALRSALDVHTEALVELKAAGCSAAQLKQYLIETHKLVVSRQRIDAWWRHRALDAKHWSETGKTQSSTTRASASRNVSESQVWPDLPGWAPNPQSTMPEEKQASAERSKRAAELKMAGFGQSVLTPRKTI